MSAPAKKPAAKSSKQAIKKKPPQHPVYKEMIVAAIKALANKSGSSKQAIGKYIKNNYKVGDRHDVHLKTSLIRGIASGVVVKKSGQGCSGSFKLPKSVVAKKIKKSAPAVGGRKKAPKKKQPSTPKKKASSASKKKVAPKKKTPTKKKVPVAKKAAPKKRPVAKKATPKKAAK